MGNPVVYFELGGRDGEALREFYGELFGWKSSDATAAAGSGYWHIEAEEGGMPGGIIQTTADMPPNYVMFYVQANDLQASLDKAESLGGTTLVPPSDIPGGIGQIAVFSDPSGNVIGLHRWNK